MSNPMKYTEEIAAHLATTNLHSLELTGPAGTLRLVRNALGFVPVAVDEANAPAPLVAVRTSGVGVLHLNHPLRATPAAPEGHLVRKGEAVAFLAVGPLLMAVAAPVGGLVAAVLAEDGAMLGYGAGVAKLEPVDDAP